MLNYSIQLSGRDGKNYQISPEGLTLGSDGANSVVIADPKVATHHARILYAEGRCFVREERGSGGTFVNGQRILGQRELHPGDQIQVGSTVFKVTAAKAPVAPPSPPRSAVTPPRASASAPAAPGAYQRRRNTVVVGLGIISIFLMLLTLGMVFLSGGPFFPAATPTDTPTTAQPSPTPSLPPTITPTLTPTPTPTIPPAFGAKITCEGIELPADEHDCTVTNLGNVSDNFFLEFIPSRSEDLNNFQVSVQIYDQEQFPDEQGYVPLGPIKPEEARTIKIRMICGIGSGCRETGVTVKLYARNGTMVIAKEGEVLIRNRKFVTPPKPQPKPTIPHKDENGHGDEGP